jgi:hypothetical protein
MPPADPVAVPKAFPPFCRRRSASFSSAWGQSSDLHVQSSRQFLIKNKAKSALSLRFSVDSPQTNLTSFAFNGFRLRRLPRIAPSDVHLPCPSFHCRARFSRLCARCFLFAPHFPFLRLGYGRQRLANLRLVGYPSTATCKSRKLNTSPIAIPLSFRAPSFRFGPNRSRFRSKNRFTNARPPITCPSVKYLTWMCLSPRLQR